MTQETPHPFAPPPQLRLGVHDRSRAEWICTVPMASPGQVHNYEVTLELQIPDQLWVPHDPWQRYQVRTRLTSPSLQAPLASRDPRDRLRLRALAVAHALKLAQKEPVLLLRQVKNRDGVLQPAEAAQLVTWMHAAMAQAEEVRTELANVVAPRDPSLERERDLADEYVSGHVLLLVARLRAALNRRVQRRLVLVDGATETVLEALKTILQSEQNHRLHHQFRQPAPRTRAEVQAYVNRSAQLKKHFQQALFLDAAAYMLDDRLRNWIAAAMAMVAAVFYFAWQVSVLNAVSAGATTVSLMLAALVGALVYAAKDRIKEVGRTWLADKLKHTYADRVVHLHLQERMDPQRVQLALARETITFQRHLEADRFNPELGKTSLVHHIVIRERLRHAGLVQLHEQGLVGLKHVFRYDLTPFLAKLDDSQKHVPVLADGAVQIRGGSRVYALPIVVKLSRTDGRKDQELLTQRGHLLLRGRSVVRFVTQPDANRANLAT